MRWGVVVLLVVHGLIHFLGPLKAFGWRDLPALSQPISRGMGLVWLLAGVLLLGSAGLLGARSPRWWVLAGVAVTVSQLAIFTAFQDAKAGTWANAVLLLFIAWGVLASGPPSFAARQTREAIALSQLVRPVAPLTQEELARLPSAVERYLRLAGAARRPPVQGYQARFRGRIRSAADQPWMDFEVEQETFLEPPTRLFHLTAERAGVPVDVFHRFSGGRATMQVRLLSLFPLVDARGPEMDRSETVTYFNDLCFLSPSALARANIEWEPMTSDRVRAHFSLGRERVSAELVFDEEGWLVDFLSGDRSRADPSGKTFQVVPWSTPLSGRRSWNGRMTFERGAAVWHNGAEELTYIEMEIIDFREHLPAGAVGQVGP